MGQAVRATAISAVKEIKGVDLPEGAESMRLDEFDIDSLDLIEVGMVIEEEYDIVLAPTDFDGVETVGELLSVLEDQVGARNSGS